MRLARKTTMEPRRDIVVIGASAGGIEAVSLLLGELPHDLRASVFVVIHTPPFENNRLPSVLGRRSSLEVAYARDGQELHLGCIYVAPPDHHLILEGERMLVRRGPKENRFRPSVDALFRSAAYVHGARVIGVVMSGALDDGTSGLWSIKRLGGIAMAQSPGDCVHPEMPRSAIEQVEVDHVGTARELGALIVGLVGEVVPAPRPLADVELRRLGVEIDIAASGGAFDKGILAWGDIAPFTCPDCHGSLVRLREGGLLRFRCNTGHAFTPRALLAGISESVGTTLDEVARGLEEETLMLEYLSEHCRHAGNDVAARQFLDAARATREASRIVEASSREQRHIGEQVHIPAELP
jgi:two-component system chemotaxis response regulator CheB